MSGVKEVIVDTFDDSLNQDSWFIVRNWRGGAALIMLIFGIPAELIGRGNSLSELLVWAGAATIVVFSGLVIWRKIVVRRRLRETGMAMSDRIPY